MTRPALRAAALLLAVLSACAPAPEGLRDPARPISSMADFSPARLEGDWLEVAGFAPCPAAGRMTIAAGRIAGTSCDLPLRGGGRLEPAGPGRFRLNGAELWVLWADFDDRTLVIGTPSGRFGAVLNRDGPIPADRLEAARRILAFNGYDGTRLAVR